MKHLTDSQIQQFVFESTGSADANNAHIQECAACRSRVEAYRLLFAEIEKLPEASFDMNLEEIIMKQLAQSSTSKNGDKMLWYGGAIVCFSSVLSLIFFFGKELTALFGGIEWLGTALLGTTALCLLVFLGVDMYRAYLAKMKTFNFE